MERPQVAVGRQRRRRQRGRVFELMVDMQPEANTGLSLISRREKLR